MRTGLVRLAQVTHRGELRVGVVDPETDEIRLLDPGTDSLELLAETPERRAELVAGARAAIPLAEVTLQTPLDPVTVRDFVSFEEHVEGMVGVGNPVSPEWYELPTFYFSNPYGLVALESTWRSRRVVSPWTSSWRLPRASPAPVVV
jgi:hypothetical protein